ncbi:FecCD family ABC transporter permease [Macrococcus capreoli]|uniref:FecCD family ABC transporter permease n=1 Tax=Macrococcus capreoli TaxID=2982690 RepID=UPI0021D56E2A|nr:iron ABC transporter permease [Macrococcus sp. TMW 2.2395]MCU7557458.1 iron ABC transporter permease [Macrococcus sp. TMW 2.2395]
MKNKLFVFGLIIIVIILSLFYDNNGVLDLNDSINRTVLLEIRLPRVMTGILVGVILSVTGYVFQTILNNYLADSFSLGLASGASFGSALSIVLSMSIAMTMLFSIAFSMLTLFIVLVASRLYHYQQQTTWMILIGMFINFFFSSLVYMLVLIVPNKATHIMNYLFGSISTVSFTDIYILVLVTVIGLMIIYYFHQQIEILGLGTERATSLGLRTDVMIYVLLITTSMMCAVLISMTGIIGFVGMIIPPFVRLNFKGSHLSKLNMTLLIAVLFVLTGDLLGREIVQPVQIPVSIMMCLLGMPLLLWVILQQHVKRLN